MLYVVLYLSVWSMFAFYYFTSGKSMLMYRVFKTYDSVNLQPAHWNVTPW